MKKYVSLLLFLLLALLSGCSTGPSGTPSKSAPSSQQKTLNLYSWADNFNPEVLAAFEKKYNCKINYDVFANNE